MKIIGGTADVLPAGLLFDIARYRQRVFVERLGWNLPTIGRLELDDFDRRDTCYVAAIDQEGDLVGTARLLPTNRPYLLAKVFPELMPDELPPSTPEVWELSRFAVLDFKVPGHKGTIFASPLALDVLSAAITLAADAGAKRLISVSPAGIERILKHAHLHTERAWPVLNIEGRRLFACWIDADRTWRPLREAQATHLKVLDAETADRPQHLGTTFGST